MDQHRTAELLRLALQLRDAAEDAGRPDVVVKIDETLALIAGHSGSTDNNLRKRGAGKLDTAITILGLGGLR